MAQVWGHWGDEDGAESRCNAARLGLSRPGHGADRSEAARARAAIGEEEKEVAVELWRRPTNGDSWRGETVPMRRRREPETEADGEATRATATGDGASRGATCQRPLFLLFFTQGGGGRRLAWARGRHGLGTTMAGDGGGGSRPIVRGSLVAAPLGSTAEAEPSGGNSGEQPAGKPATRPDTEKVEEGKVSLRDGLDGASDSSGSSRGDASLDARQSEATQWRGLVRGRAVTRAARRDGAWLLGLMAGVTGEVDAGSSARDSRWCRQKAAAAMTP
ncbi:hypothetical protein E2562_032721 [Oryza meyeriana var. granulata]|uniref:DUF834 domain-containing protein n=1 Tax=Oryza meyeriana var. granulata TaxID=110450 RepID=A0A6G1ES43_9ORYZ|nr:hypothetical protein E2562_032721 [Oryza meyeriana var. granulata]